MQYMVPKNSQADMGSIQSPSSGAVLTSLSCDRTEDDTYLDAAIKRGAECDTHRQLLCVRMMMTSKGYHWKLPPTRTKGFDVSKLAGGRKWKWE